MAQGDKDIDERLRTIRTKYRRDNNLDLLPAVVGDVAGNVIDPALPGNVYVREQTSNGLSDRRSVRAPVQLMGQLKPGLSVLLERDVQGRLQIAKINTDMLLASGGNPIVYQAQQQSTGVMQVSFETLRLIPTSPASLVVALKSWYAIAGSTVYYFPGAPVDLTANVPAAGNMLYAVIGVKNDFITIEVTVSTARLLTDVPLDVADINEAVLLLSTGTTPAWAVKLSGGQTTITQTDIQNDAKDLRQLVNGEPTFIKEYRVEAVSSVLGTSAPTVSTRAIGASGGVKAPVLQFSKTTQNDCYFEIHAPSDLIDAHNVAFHVMLGPGAAWTTGNFMIKLEYLTKNGTGASTATGTPTTIQYDYTPGAATDLTEVEFVSTIDLNAEQTLICHFYRDVANDNGDDVLSVRFFELNYVARLT